MSVSKVPRRMPLYQFVLIPRFSLVAFSCAIDALRGANQVLGESHYEWQTVSAEGDTALSTSSIVVPTELIPNDARADVIAICGGDSSHSYENATLTNWLHDQAKAGTRIGSISDGAFVAAAAGLFDQVPSTIHWKCYDAYRERFPKLDIKPSIIEISKTRFSCAGGTSSLDLMLHFIREAHGAEITSQIAENYFHDTIRDGSREQHVTNAFRIASRNPVLADALLLMEGHLEARLTITEIAKQVNISRRQLDRIFKRDMKQSPQEFYRYLRLTRASGLLLQTGMSVTEVSLACGFQSASHMGKFFHSQFGLTPGAYRRHHAVGQGGGT